MTGARTTRRVYLVCALAVTCFWRVGEAGAVDAPKGAARRWEASMPAGLYSQVNLRTGRVLTTIPITGWSGRGPSIQFNLYHNQNSAWGSPGMIQGDLNGDEVIDENDIDPFINLLLQTSWTDEELKLADMNGDGQITLDDLYVLVEKVENPPTEPDWRHSYSSKLVIQGNGDVLLIRDDGTEDLFTLANGSYTAPDGVWDTLTADTDGSGGFLLTSKHQWQAHFYNLDGSASTLRRLDWISDASNDGNGSRVNKGYCEYDDFNPWGQPPDWRLKRVWDASQSTAGDYPRGIELLYSCPCAPCNNCPSQRRLNGIRAFPTINNVDRLWNLLYDAGDTLPPSTDGTGPLLAMEYPHEDTLNPPIYRIAVTYNGTWDIETMTDRYKLDASGNPVDPRPYRLDYVNARLDQITDPLPTFDPPPATSLIQRFYYFNSGAQLGEWITSYMDRRGQ